MWLYPEVCTVCVFGSLYESESRRLVAGVEAVLCVLEVYHLHVFTYVLSGRVLVCSCACTCVCMLDAL